jgi:Tfp pilus assembly protein PilN
MKRLHRRARISIALGHGRLTAEMRRGGAVRTIALDAGADTTAALAALRARLEADFPGTVDGARITVALLPPLAESRLLSLPPLRPAEADAVVRRDAGRYFLAVPTPRVTAVDTTAGGPVLAGAADARLLEALRGAAAAAGWHLDGITTAHAAWIAAARAVIPARERGGAAIPARGRGVAAASARTTAAAVVAVHDGTAHVMTVVNGRAAALRRVLASELDEIVASATGAMDVDTGGQGRSAPARSVALMVDESLRPVLTDRFRAVGWTVAGEDDADLAAARSAAAAPLRLVPATMMADRRDRERRRAVQLTAAAAALLLLTAGIEYWGAARELDAVRGRRADIRAQVGPLLAMRDSIDRLTAYASDIDAAARTSPRWTAALFDLAMLLPPESYLTRLYATGDTLVIDAQGERAGAALQALRGSAVLRDARLLGAIDRELADGATSTERFRIRARLAAPADASAPDPVTPAAPAAASGAVSAGQAADGAAPGGGGAGGRS